MKISTRRREAWLRHPFGARLLAAERAQMDAILPNLFGYYLLQVGGWGPSARLCESSRIRTRLMVDHRIAGADLVADSCAWPIETGSVDVVVLPHTLELDGEPHMVLREAERVLTAEGHLIVLGINPWSLWRLFRPGRGRVISERRLREWLSLLGLQVRAVYRHSPTWPAGAYVLVARKRVEGMTLIGPKVRKRVAIEGAATTVG